MQVLWPVLVKCAYFVNNVIGMFLYAKHNSLFSFLEWNMTLTFQKFHQFHVSYINQDDWPDWSHSRQEMTSVWPELMEFTSQGWSVSMMCIIWLRSAAEKPSFHNWIIPLLLLLIQYLIIKKQWCSTWPISNSEPIKSVCFSSSFIYNSPTGLIILVIKALSRPLSSSSFFRSVVKAMRFLQDQAHTRGIDGQWLLLGLFSHSQTYAISIIQWIKMKVMSTDTFTRDLKCEDDHCTS